MAMAGNINAGQSSEWALLKRHESENLFGLQIASGHPNELSLCAKVGAVLGSCFIFFRFLNMKLNQTLLT